MVVKLFRCVAFGLVLLLTGSAFAQDAPSVEEAVEDSVEEAPQGILVFGGTRATGLEVVKILAGRGEQVTVFVRPTSDLTQLEPLGVELYTGDALEADSVKAAFDAGSYRAVISSLGSRTGDNPVDDVGNINVAEAAKATGVDRMLMVSSIGAGESRSAIPFFVRWILGSALERKTKAENHIINSGLNYTIIRPGGLGDGPPTGTGVLDDDQQSFKWGRIPRAEVARQLVLAFDNPDSANTIYHVFPE